MEERKKKGWGGREKGIEGLGGRESIQKEDIKKGEEEKKR